MLKRSVARCARWLLRWAEPPAADDRVLRVIERAAFKAGVDTAHFGPSLDLSRSGKIPEIVYMTARELGPASPLQTVAALYAAFRPR